MENDNDRLIFETTDGDGDNLQILQFKNGDIILQVWNEEEKTANGVVLNTEMLIDLCNALTLAKLRALEKFFDEMKGDIQ